MLQFVSIQFENMSNSKFSLGTILLLINFTFLTAGTLYATEMVGTTAAKFGVTPGGAASYSIAIGVPKGTAKLEPSLNLQYNSRDTNNIMGLGWKITGLSYINRCETNLYVDDPDKGGVGIDPVDYDENDKFCLNGERLMAFNGNYGADGTEYRTYFEEFSKIVSHGVSPEGPTSFTVYKKSGEILKFGGTESSRFRRQSENHIRTWALSKLADAKGNYISYTYHNDRVNGEQYISRIDYTGNAAQGLAPYNRLEFLYEDRPDKLVLFKAGDKITLGKRLKKIQVFTVDQLAHEYRFSYELGHTKKSRLKSITECANADTCFKPTVFEWNNAAQETPKSFSYINQSHAVFVEGTENVPKSLDFNGDGRLDVLLWERGQHNAYYKLSLLKNDGTGKFTQIAKFDRVSWDELYIGDYNGDGLHEFSVREGQNRYIYFSNGNGTFRKQLVTGPEIPHGPEQGGGSIKLTGDFNGDGRTDFIAITRLGSSADAHLFYSNGDGSFSKESLGMDLKISIETLPISGDFNGDGITDVHLNNIGSDNILLSRKDGVFKNVVVSSEMNLKPKEQKVLGVQDFNGDGLSDLVVASTKESHTLAGKEYIPSGPVYIWYSRGDGVFEKSIAISNLHFHNNIEVTQDVNGDNLADLILSTVHFESHSGSFTRHQSRRLFLSKGDRTFEDPIELALNISNSNSSYKHSQLLLTGDFDGDGLGDFVTRDILTIASEVDFHFSLVKANVSNFIPHERVTGITNGHGLSTKISYKPLTDSSVYMKGDTAVYPVRDSVFADNVVSEVSADNGLGGQNRKTYFYEGLQTHMRGLRNLGFRRMVMTDIVTGIKTETIYNQDWTTHHQGLLKQSKTISPDGTVMNSRIMNWGVRGQRDAHGKFVNCFRFAIETAVIKRDLNGAFISKEIEQTTFDDYGFRTTIRQSSENEDGSVKFVKLTSNTFAHNVSGWRLGQLINTVVTHSKERSEPLNGGGNGGGTATEIQTIADENFESAATGWNENTTDDGGVTFTKFLGRNNGSGNAATQQVFKTFDVPVGATEVKIEFDAIEIGTWNNKKFTVYVDDVVKAEETFNWEADTGTNDHSNVTATGQIGNTPVEKHHFVLTIPVSGETNTIKVGFGAPALNEWASFGYDGWWGVDNLKIIATVTVETPAPEVPQNQPEEDLEALIVTRSKSFTYDNDGYLLSETLEPGHALFLTKTNTLNAYGLVETVTETWGSTDTDGIASTSRSTSYEYDSKYRFITKETNPLGHVKTKTYHPVLGLATSTTEPNDLTTLFHFDVFGRQIRETRADNTSIEDSMDFCGGDIVCPSGAVYRKRRITSAGAEKTIFLNKLNLEVRVSTLIDGKWSHVLTEYDALGREYRKSEPHFEGETVYWTVIQYDILDRKIRVDRPDSSFQIATFNGLTQISTNELDQKKTVIKNLLKKEDVVTNDDGDSIHYGYDAAGQILSMTTNGSQTIYAYDKRGFKTSDTDPDKGRWIYRHNALGKMVERTNAKGETTRMTYDLLDRMLTRIDAAAEADPEHRTVTWIYDTAVNGIGKVHKVLSPGYNATSSYDSFGRVISVLEQIEGEDLLTSTSYDSQSRPDEIKYPSNIIIKNTYGSQGELLKVGKPDGSETWWERKETDARGNVSLARHGNGVETRRMHDPKTGRLTAIYSFKGNDIVQDLIYQKDYLGNLTRREDKRLSQVETFTYDNLNRVTSVSTAVGGNANSVTMAYGVTGNIQSKSDVGTYTYGEIHASCGTAAFAGPHAVTAVVGAKNATYCYDANGNMTSGDGRTTTYTSFDKPDRIAKGGNIAVFTYGPDRMRYKRVDETVSGGVKTTLYAAGKAFERIQDSNGTVMKHYIGDFAVISHTIDGNGGTNRTSYLHRDHLGSVDTITDESGLVEQRMSFDSWGKRREINWQAMPDSVVVSFNSSITTRGFTGHEMIDTVGLVHMNGRVYEPELGRFLSADPVIEAIDNLQTYNRYSYVRNNPLTFTDPSGFKGDAADSGSPEGVSPDAGGNGAEESVIVGKAPVGQDEGDQSNQETNNDLAHLSYNEATLEALGKPFNNNVVKAINETKVAAKVTDNQQSNTGQSKSTDTIGKNSKETKDSKTKSKTTSNKVYTIVVIASILPPVGHLALGFIDPVTGEMVAWGFYPEEEYDFDALYTTVKGRVRDDTVLFKQARTGKNPGLVTYEMKVTKEQYEIVLNTIKGYDGKGYNISKCSCVHAVKGALAAANLSIPEVPITTLFVSLITRAPVSTPPSPHDVFTGIHISNQSKGRR